MLLNIAVFGGLFLMLLSGDHVIIGIALLALAGLLFAGYCRSKPSPLDKMPPDSANRYLKHLDDGGRFGHRGGDWQYKNLSIDGDYGHPYISTPAAPPAKPKPSTTSPAKLATPANDEREIEDLIKGVISTPRSMMSKLVLSNRAAEKLLRDALLHSDKT